MKTKLLLCLSVGILLASCSSGPTKESITGKWDIVSFETTVPELQEDYHYLLEMAVSTTYEFKEDGKFVKSNTYSESDMGGDWALGDDASTLTLTYSEANMSVDIKFDITKYEDGRMSLTEDVGTGKSDYELVKQ